MALALATCALANAEGKQLTLDVAEAGTLSALVGSEQASSVTSLTLTGKLNSTDIKFLRRLAGVDEYGDKVVGNSLAHIDMAGADIVAGGEPYYYTYTTVDSIVGDFFFSGCTQLESFRMSASAKGIEWSAFEDCTGISEFAVADSVRYIDNDAFKGCTSMATVTLGKNVADIEGYAFIGCTALTSITLPQSVSTIGEFAFSGCTSLSSVNIPAKVENLGMFAFSDDSQLTTVDIADGVKQIGKDAFSGCTALASIVLPNSIETIDEGAFDGCESLASIVLPAGLKAISESMLSNCTSLECIDLPKSVTTIGESAFCYDEALLGIDIPDSVVEIGDDAFFDCLSMTKARLGSGVATLGEDVFKFCDALKTIEVAEGNENYASVDGVLLDGDKTTLIFLPPANCEEYAVPASVRRIGDGAAITNKTLRKVTIHDDVESIGHDAFSVCDSLRSVVIGSGVKEIGDDAFFMDEAIEEIHCRIAEPLEIGDYVFWGPDVEKCVLYVPAGSKQAYSEADVWKDFLNIEEETTTAVRHAKAADNNIVVYGIDGNRVYEGAKDGFKPTAKGTYIIKEGMKTVKVAM